MTPFVRKLFISIFLIGVVYLGYKAFYPTYSWHQKLTVEVETPEGVVSGSSVVAVKWIDGPKILPDGRAVKDSHKGEATIVELPDGRYLFALLGNGTPSLSLHVFATSKVGYGMDSRIVPASEVDEHEGEIRPIPPEHYPLMVTFDDFDDPASVKRVEPNDLTAAFGAGYLLKSVTLEITDEALTRGEVEKVLGWINSTEILKNPVWRNLPTIAQKTIAGLKKPFGE